MGRGAEFDEAAQPKFLRVGHWPENERSGNFATGKREKGVSVYRLDEAGRPVPTEGEWGDEPLHAHLSSDDPKFVVTGQHVGHGHDGEPLLRQVKKVRDYDPAEHYSTDDINWWRHVHHGGPRP